MNEFATTDFDDNEPGGSSLVTSLPVDNTMGLNDPLFDDTGRTVGNQTLYSTTADNFNNVASVDPSIIDKLSGFAKNLYTTNGAVDFRKVATLLGGGLAAFNASPGNKGGSGAGYQGGIPTLYAGRNMLTAPPAMVGGKPRRAGSGGINYGGDVTYFNTKAEVDALKAAEAAALANQNTGSAGINTLVPGGTATTVTPGNVTYPGSTVPLNSTGLTPQIANYLMYKATTTGANTSDFNKYGGYAAVKAVAQASGMDVTPEWIANYEQTAGLAPSQATIDNPPGSYPTSSSTASTNTAVTNQAASADTGEVAAKRQVVGSTPILPGEVHIGGGIFRTRDGSVVDSQGQKVGLAEGGMAKGRYLQGGTDGMADELPARIGADQPAALSHGEFVIPADVVSHMGNGNSDAGAKKLYQMMDKIRMARTGNKKQGKKINPDKFMPGGLAAAYAAGGKVQGFDGTTTSKVTDSTLANAGYTGTESNLSNWAGPYVTGMLGQGQALANMPYQAYTGDLTAGTSPLLSSAFTNASALSTPSSIGDAATTAGSIATKAKDLAYSPTTSSFDSTQLTNYMNPYLDKILTPQLEAARRQSEITQQQNAGQMTKAGAYGGGRQAIMDTETQRNLADTQANITGKGYDTAYQNALSQFNADQQRKMQEGQFGASYGLQGLNTGLQAAQAQGGLGVQQNQVGLANLAQQLAAGTVQRGIESEGIAADKAQFEEARANPYKMVQFQQSLLQGLPLASQAYNTGSESALVAAARGAGTVNQLLKNLGITMPV